MKRKKHNSGIALVMVLGILSVMVIMAVAFAISMRTERVAAGNYADSVRARQLVHVGITRAINKIQQDLSFNLFTVSGGNILLVSQPYQTGMPVVVSSTGTLPSSLSPGTIYYTIYVSDNQIRLASSYVNAKNGNHINIINDGSGQHSIQLWLKVNVNPFDDTLTWGDPLKFNTGTRIVLSSMNTFPSPLTNVSYYAIYVANTQIKVASSYQEALNGTNINIINSGIGDLYLSQNGQVYPPWDAISSYGTNFMTQVSQVKSEKFTKQIDYLKVRGHYRLGDKVSVTSTTNLPSPLMEDTPYYVVSILSNGIRLGTSYPGPPIAIGPDLGGTHTISHYFSTGRNFIPGALWNHVAQVDSSAETNYWEKIETLIAESNYVTVGRVAYLIANCSGLLDANYVGGAPRGGGTNPSEMAIGNMPEFKPAGAAAFLARRNSPDSRYETLEEFAVLNSNAFNGSPSNFTVYSYAPSGYWNGSSNQPQVNLAGSVGDLTNRQSVIINTFTNIGFSLPEAGILYSNLIDYVDNDSVPSNFEYCVESVPMINEIVFKSQDDTNGVLNSIKVELWYPFISAPGTFQLSVSFSVDDGVGLQNNTTNITITAGGMTVLPFERYATITNPAYSFTLTNIVVETTLGQGVDKIISGIPFTQPINRNSQVSKQVNDPRFNSNISDTNTWWPTTIADTLGTINTLTANFLSTNSAGDTKTEMFVANAPLRSVAELGYLVYSSNYPWRTVALYGANLRRVLDAFAIGTNGTDTFVANTIYYGRVNPNSRETYALATVFADMSVDNGVHKLSFDQATNIATHLQANVQTYGFYMNLSDISQHFTNFPSTVTNELQQKAFLGNTIGLLNVKQNLFTIIIEAQVASGGNIPRNPVRQRAVVLVWRDSYTGEIFKRKITWLGD